MTTVASAISAAISAISASVSAISWEGDLKADSAPSQL